MHTLHANGLELAYDSFGNPHDPAILLVAGLGTQMIRWTESFCRSLAAEGFRVIRFDNRDSGGSTHFGQHGAPDLGALVATLMAGQRPQVPYSLHDMVRDALSLLDALAIERAHVVGRSMGGMIAQLMACEHPERVLSLTSIMSSTGNPTLPQAAPDIMALLMRPAPDPLIDEAGFLAHDLTFARRIAGSAQPFDEAAHRELILEEKRRARGTGGLSRQIAAIAAIGDLRPRLATIRAPTLVIHGAGDPLILPACGEDSAASIPGAELLLIEGMGHDLPPVHDPLVSAAIVRNARRA